MTVFSTLPDIESRSTLLIDDSLLLLLLPPILPGLVDSPELARSPRLGQGILYVPWITKISTPVSCVKGVGGVPTFFTNSTRRFESPMGAHYRLGTVPLTSGHCLKHAGPGISPPPSSRSSGWPACLTRPGNCRRSAPAARSPPAVPMAPTSRT